MTRCEKISVMRAAISVVLVAIAVTAAVTSARTAQAQDTWEYAPYHVRVWLAVRPSAGLPEYVQTEILQQLRIQSPLYAGATWELVAEKAPESITPT